jgi:hypothetical protein
MPTSQCPYFKEFETRCSFTGKQVTSLDNTLIVGYCYKNYLTCTKYQEWTRQAKKDADARRTEAGRREREKAPDGPRIVDDLEKEIF